MLIDYIGLKMGDLGEYISYVSKRNNLAHLSMKELET